jgi:hypothetical protein
MTLIDEKGYPFTVTATISGNVLTGDGFPGFVFTRVN